MSRLTISGRALVLEFSSLGLDGEEAAGDGGQEGGRHVDAHRPLEGLPHQHLQMGLGGWMRL